MCESLLKFKGCWKGSAVYDDVKIVENISVFIQTFRDVVCGHSLCPWGRPFPFQSDAGERQVMRRIKLSLQGGCGGEL